MNPRVARATAWGTFAVTLVVYAAIFALAFPTSKLPSQSTGWSGGGSAVWLEGAFLLSLLTFSVVGVMIATRRRERHRMAAPGDRARLGNCELRLLRLRPAPASRVSAVRGRHRGDRREFLGAADRALGHVSDPAFPDGHLLTPRWRWVAWISAAAIVVGTVSLTLTPGTMGNIGYPHTTNPLGISSLSTVIGIAHASIILIPVCMALSALSLILRYRRSHGVERLQAKWLVAAAATVALIYAIVAPVSIALTLHSATPVWLSLLQDIALFSFFLVPVAIGFAVLRYRLFEIDVIIQKTLVYATLVAMLALLYLGGIAALGWIARTATGQSGAIAVTLSTLAVAAAFQPLRTRIQRTVDRRFYRAKYDVAETLEAFSSGLRRQIDLDSLHADVLGIVGSTMHPSHVSLWLRPTEPVERSADR